MRDGAGDLQTMALNGDSQGFARVANADSLVLIVGRTSAQGREFELSARHFDPVTAIVAAANPTEDTVAGLNAPFPNPFNSQIVLTFDLDVEAGAPVLRVYGALGNPVRTFVLGPLPRGTHRVTWDGTDDDGRKVASGGYLAMLKYGSFTGARSLTLVR
jgi:hypothetical protein